LGNLLFLKFRHALKVDLLHDKLGAITFSGNKKSLPEGSSAQDLTLIVSLSFVSLFDVIHPN
jgi:hypothetical protein